MAQQINLLSDIQLKNWVSKGEALAKSDGAGLTFTLSKAGTATWVLRYRQAGGRRKEVTIGNYPDVGLSAAREKARALRASIDAGTDPAMEKRLDKVRQLEAWTMQQLVDDFRARCLTEPTYSRRTILYRNYDYDGVVLPKLGKRPVKDVAPIEIVEMIKSADKTWCISKRLLTSTSKLFDHACGLKLVNANPCTGIKLSALKGPRPPVRKRVMLEEAELRKLLPDVNLIGAENALALRILLATCVRGIELVRAKKQDLHLDRGVWWVPDDSVKTRQGFLVPLVPAVVGWFRELIALSGESDYILPARQERRRRGAGGDTHVGETTLWASIKRAFDRQEIEIRRFTPHDTRSTAKGHMRNMGVSREISEIALNHTLKGMEAIYDVREEIPERRAALELWTNFLIDCERGHVPPKQLPKLRLVA